jgi:thymidylate synthase ThyX
MMTHRMFSRNSSSSRAIPIEKLIQQVIDDPVMPVEWGKNQKGMQAREEISDTAKKAAEQGWLGGRDEAVATARYLSNLGVHKQLVNRVLEPWMWITVIISATEYENFFKLRCHEDAQPEVKRIADMMCSAYEANTPVELEFGQWHLPFINDHELSHYSERELCLLSTARSARVSYLTHDGAHDPVRDFELASSLMDNKHWSPTEHPAMANPGSMYGNFNGFTQFRKTFPDESGKCQSPVLQ